MIINLSDTAGKPLPDKEKGKHRFIATVAFIISENAAVAAATGIGDAPMLDQENLWGVDIGCVDCEQKFTMTLNRFCPAPAYETGE